jgi:hypothetical protein
MSKILILAMAVSGIAGTVSAQSAHAGQCHLILKPLNSASPSAHMRYQTEVAACLAEPVRPRFELDASMPLSGRPYQSESLLDTMYRVEALRLLQEQRQLIQEQRQQSAPPPSQFKYDEPLDKYATRKLAEATNVSATRIQTAARFIFSL